MSSAVDPSRVPTFRSPATSPEATQHAAQIPPRKREDARLGRVEHRQQEVRALDRLEVLDRVETCDAQGGRDNCGSSTCDAVGGERGRYGRFSLVSRSSGRSNRLAQGLTGDASPS